MRNKHKAIAWGLLANSIFNLSSPQHIYIEPTNDCRLNCSICPNKDSKSKIGYLDFDLFKKVIDEISLFGKLKSIALHKSGEPLLHHELPNMIKYIKNHIPFVKISFSTSGMSLNKKVSKEIIEATPDQIFISYGNFLIDSEKHIVKNETIDTLSKNIKSFLKTRREFGKKKPRVTLRLIDKKGDFRLLNATKTKWHDMSDEIEIRPYHSWCGYFQRSYDIPQKRTPCLNLWTTLAINWDGEVSICSLDYAKDGIVGNIKNSNLKDIWNGKKLRFFRKQHLKNNYKNLKPCENCTEWRHNVGFWTKENIEKIKAQLL